MPGTFKIEYAPATVPCLGGYGKTILQPINANGLSVFKQGATVPAKFRVCDASGNSVGTPGVVTAFRLMQIKSGTVTLVNEEVLSTAADSAFRWSADGAQWIFNISTEESAVEPDVCVSGIAERRQLVHIPVRSQVTSVSQRCGRWAGPR